MHTLAAVAAATRPRFLLLTPICVALGLICARRAGAVMAPATVSVVMAGALCAHAAVNLLNEADDARSGVDALTVRTPFSGGSGALQRMPDAYGRVRAAGLACALLTVLAGLWLVIVSGPGILPVGLAGLMLVFAYTPWINRHPWLCLAAPGLGVGPLMVLGSEFALAGRVSLAGIAVATITGLLGSNLLLLNQYPDIEADRAGGRRHLLIVRGPRYGARIYAGIVVAATLVCAGAVYVGVLPALALVATIPLAAGLGAAVGLQRYVAGAAGPLQPLLGLNVACALGTPLVIAIALWWQ